MPVLGFPRPAAGVGGPAGSVTTSFLVREVDVLVPGSLLMVTTGEGYAPDELCPCATVASEMDGPVALKHAHDEVVVGVSTSGGGAVLDETNIEGSHVAGIATHVQRDDVPFAQGLADGAVMDGAELLVEMMDAETGLCLGKRVPMGELRHSTTFFGRELDAGSTTVRQVCHMWGIQYLIVDIAFMFRHAWHTHLREHLRWGFAVCVTLMSRGYAGKCYVSGTIILRVSRKGVYTLPML